MTRKRKVLCDPKKVQAFDYGKLDAAFAKLAKPAQWALMNAKIFTPRDLAQYGLEKVGALHGMGPASLPILKAALKIQ
jgi:hypothetical protein